MSGKKINYFCRNCGGDTKVQCNTYEEGYIKRRHYCKKCNVTYIVKWNGTDYTDIKAYKPMKIEWL